MTAEASASFNFPRSVSGNPIRWLIVGGVFLIAAITIGTTIIAGNFRERALNSSERELENTVLLLARHFDDADPLDPAEIEAHADLAADLLIRALENHVCPEKTAARKKK